MEDSIIYNSIKKKSINSTPSEICAKGACNSPKWTKAESPKNARKTENARKVRKTVRKTLSPSVIRSQGYSATSAKKNSTKSFFRAPRDIFLNMFQNFFSRFARTFISALRALTNLAGGNSLHNFCYLNNFFNFSNLNKVAFCFCVKKVFFVAKFFSCA